MSSSEESGEIKYNKPKNNIFNHKIIKKIGEGTFGEVYESISKNLKYALKKIPTNSSNGISITTIREVKILKLLSHKNIIEIKDIICNENKSSIRTSKELYIVFGFYSLDLERYIKNNKMTINEIKVVTKQITEAVNYMHKKGIIHRDLKTANILLNDIYNIKICDFGLAKIIENNEMTPGLVTLWYRAPEILLGYKFYDEKIDVWSIGCIVGEMCHGKPILRGRCEIEMLEQIVYLCGSINERTCTNYKKMDLHDKFTLPQGINRIENSFSIYGKELCNFMYNILNVDHVKRPSAEALMYFDFLLDETMKKN